MHVIICLCFCVLCLGAGFVGGWLSKTGPTKVELENWKARLESSIDKDEATARGSIGAIVAEIKKKL
jgi:hypothetical protein